MGRVVSTTLAAAIGALVLTGCGAETTVTGTAQLSVSAPAPKRVEPTDGRLGDATTVAAGARPRELSPGGRLDLRPRNRAPRRDGVGAGAACANADLRPSRGSLPAMAEATLCLLNGERADRGLATLRPNAKLAAAATAYADDLVAGSYFSHTGRDGSDVFERIDRTGYLPGGAGWLLGENLAWGTGSLSTPGAIMLAWMNSAGHRENILTPGYREIGVGVVAGNPAAADGLGATYATEFGAIDRGADADAVVVVKRSSAGKRRRSKARSARRADRARGGKQRGKRRR